MSTGRLCSHLKSLTRQCRPFSLLLSRVRCIRFQRLTEHVRGQGRVLDLEGKQRVEGVPGQGRRTGRQKCSKARSQPAARLPEGVLGAMACEAGFKAQRQGFQAERRSPRRGGWGREPLGGRTGPPVCWGPGWDPYCFGESRLLCSVTPPWPRESHSELLCLWWLWGVGRGGEGGRKGRGQGAG